MSVHVAPQTNWIRSLSYFELHRVSSSCSLWILSAIDLRSLLKKGCVMCCTTPATRTRPTGPSSPPRPAPGQAQKGPSQEWSRAPNLDCAKVCTCLHRVKMVYYKRPSVVNKNNQKHQLTSLCARFATKLTLAVTELLPPQPSTSTSTKWLQPPQHSQSPCQYLEKKFRLGKRVSSMLPSGQGTSSTRARPTRSSTTSSRFF